MMVDKMDKKELPLVSVIIPVYNGSNYIREAIDSALAQSYKNCEVIVINDGSTDNGLTEKIALSYGNKIRYFYKENGGVSSALNFGIKQMKGIYFSWLSHDDRYYKDKIKKQIELLMPMQNEKVVALCEIDSINQESKRIKGKSNKRFLQNGKAIEWTDALMNLLKYGSFYGCGLLIPKVLLEECGLFRENLKFCQDYLMWILLFLNKSTLVYTDEVLVSLRIHEGQLTQKGRSIYHRESIIVAENVIPRLAQISQKEHNYLYYYAKDITKYNNPSIFHQCMVVANQKKLFNIWQKLKLRVILCYGYIRPGIRKIYYRLFRKMNTQSQ